MFQQGGQKLKDILIKRLKKHDESALEEVMNKYLPLVSAIVYNIGRNRLTKEDMEETIADVFVILWQNTDNIIEGKLQGYLSCIARTRALDKLSSVKKAQTVDIDELEMQSDFSIEATAETDDITELLNSLINELCEPDREIMLRYYYYQQTAPMIAKILGMNKETVKSRLRRAKEKLRLKLTERGYAP